MGYSFLMPACAGLLEPGGLRLKLLKFELIAKKIHMHIVLVYLQPYRCNSLLKCALKPKIAKKITKNPLLKGSKAFKVIDVNKSKKASRRCLL